jgi:hypothetical protein
MNKEINIKQLTSEAWIREDIANLENTIRKCKLRELNGILDEKKNKILSFHDEKITRELFYEFTEKVREPLSSLGVWNENKRLPLVNYAKDCWKYMTDTWLMNGIPCSKEGSVEDDLKMAVSRLLDEPEYEKKLPKEFEKYEQNRIINNAIFHTKDLKNIIIGYNGSEYLNEIVCEMGNSILSIKDKEKSRHMFYEFTKKVGEVSKDLGVATGKREKLKKFNE